MNLLEKNIFYLEIHSVNLNMIHYLHGVEICTAKMYLNIEITKNASSKIRQKDFFLKIKLNVEELNILD